MNIPANVSITKQGTKLVLTTPFHSAVVEWAHQNGGRWNGEWRAWVVDDSPGQAERFAALVSAIWPDGVATSQGRSGPRRAVTAGRAVSTAGSVETCARCKVVPATDSLADIPLCGPCGLAVITWVTGQAGSAGSSPVAPVSREPAPVSQERPDYLDPANQQAVAVATKVDRAALRAALARRK